MSKEEFFEGYSIPRNKELMRVYKYLDMVEQLGSGIPRILEHYGKDAFHFSENFLRMTFLATEQVTEQVRNLLKVMRNSEYSRMELMALLQLTHREHFRVNYLQKAIELDLIELTIPDKPRSSKQKYKLTQKGIKQRSK